MRKRAFLRWSGAAGAAFFTMGVVNAQDKDYPVRPIRLVVPFPAGGGVDAVARVLAERLGAGTGQTVIVDNRGGGGGSVGAVAVANATPDGYTIMLNTNGHVILPNLQKTDWHPIKDFIPISEVAALPFVIFTQAGSRFASIGQLIAAAKANPGKLTYGSSGIGSSLHLGMEMFANRAGIKLLHVPYKGNAPMAAALLGGEIDMYMDTLAVSYPFVRQGKFRALAITTPKRIKTLPDVPTLAESGLAGFDYVGWQGLFAPAGTPAPVVARLVEEVGRVMATPAVRRKIEELGYEPRGTPPREFAAMIEEDSRRYRQVIVDAQIKAE